MTDSPQILFYLSLGFSFLAVVVLAAGLGAYFAGRFSRVSRRLVEAGGGRAGGPDESSWWRSGGETFIHRLSNWNDPKDELEKSRMRRRLSRAGHRGSSALRTFLGLKAALFLGGAGAGFVLSSSLSEISTATMALLIVGFATAGFYLPDIVVTLQGTQRREHIYRVLPDMVDLLVICMESGMALSAALKKVSEEMSMASRPMFEELKIVLFELETGLARADALKNLASRTGLEEIQSLAGMLIQADKFGTSIARSLRVFAQSMRANRTQRAEEQAAKVGVKLTLPLILCIFPTLLFVILSPACLRLYQALVGPSGVLGG
ncbi:MAG: type II secretion system F family protein [Deltaproteobacteria bacterium]|nr:type II secretion system F family protein [Deltaproteobacteria bacterium]